MHDRLDHYEKLLKQHGILPKGESEQTSPAAAAPLDGPHYQYSNWKDSQQQSRCGTGTIVAGDGKFRYIDSNVWRSLNEEDFHPSSDEEEDDDTQSPSVYQSPIPADPLSAALLGPGSPSQNLLNLHPTYESAMKLWKIYVDKIDPIVKVVHVPSGLAMLQRAAANPSTASKSTEALLFAIYAFAVSCTDEAECKDLFGQPQSLLQARYHDAARQALVNAYFMRTTEFAVVQAFVLFLFAVRSRYDPHTFWILTGVGIRLGQRMGLHRDGEQMGLKPFDVQMRRRVFWQLLPLDGIAAQLCGTGIAITADSWDTKQPLNVNDSDIWPGMTEIPEPRNGATDMIFCLARTEIGRFHQKANPPLGNWATFWVAQDISAADQALKELEEHMETNYLRYCDFVNPLHCLTMAMCRGAMSVGKLRMRLPRAKNKDITDEERRELWTLANKVLDYDVASHSNASLQRYMWHIRALAQWDPLIWVLNEIRRDPLLYQGEPIWPKIEAFYSNHPDLSAQKRAIQVAVGRLTLRSWNTFQQSLKPEQRRPEPTWISTLKTRMDRRGSGQLGSIGPPKHEYNPFNPDQDASDDLGVPVFSAVTHNGDGMNFNSITDFDTDSTDWMFWDQLIHNPDNFATVQ